MLRLTTIAVLTLACLTPAWAAEGPSAQCAFNADKSSLVLTVSNTGAQAYACTASCQYTETGKRPLQTLGCNFNLAGNTAARAACDIDGQGPGHFAEVRPTRFVCQPR